VLQPAVLRPPLLPPIEIPPVEHDGITEEEDVAREWRHLELAWRNSVTTVIIDVWDRSKRRHDAADKE
jgi:hypothetical protein